MHNMLLSRHIILDRLVASDDSLEAALREFTPISPIEGVKNNLF